MLAIASELLESVVGSSWLARIAQSFGIIAVLYAAINRFIKHPLINAAARWIGIPIATLHVFGVLGEVTHYLDTVSLEAGNIRLSLYTLVKAAIAGGILFWLGRLSNDAGQKVIRKQETLDIHRIPELIVRAAGKHPANTSAARGTGLRAQAIWRDRYPLRAGLLGVGNRWLFVRCAIFGLGYPQGGRNSPGSDQDRRRRCLTPA